MFIINNKKIFIGISSLLVVLSIVAMVVFGFNFGIDFKGGALTEIYYEGSVPEKSDIAPLLENLKFGSILIQPTRSNNSQGRPEQDRGTTGEDGYILKSRELSDTEHQTLLDTMSLGGKYSFTEANFNSIGPSVGRELTRKAVTSIILVSLAIILFIAYTFRKSSVPVSSWKYGIIAIVTLLHDVIIPVGIFVIISSVTGVEVDTLFVVAVLTILGLSVSDTIVIFDRIRENLRLNIENRVKENFSQTVGRSLEQSFVRSIATSTTVILVLLSLVFFGPVSTKYFALMLTAGMFFGTYSSIFLASPLLVWIEERQQLKK